MNSKNQLGLVAICALVLLRVGIGWHFTSEGYGKLRNGFTSVPFMASAKGPFAGYFHSFVWDADGKIRLGFDREPIPQKLPEGAEAPQRGRPTINIQETISAWEEFREEVISRYGFDDRQKRNAHARARRRIDHLKRFFRDNQEEITKYFNGLDRRDSQRADAAYQSVATLQGQAARLDADLKKARAPLLNSVSLMWSEFERDLLSIATGEQLGTKPPRLQPPGKAGLGTDFVDWIIPRFDLLIGILLIIGLFTRVAAGAAALFLGSVILTQWPWAGETVPVYNQFVEALALVFLAVVGAGRYAGLDKILHCFYVRCCGKRQPEGKGTHEQPDA